MEGSRVARSWSRQLSRSWRNGVLTQPRDLVRPPWIVLRMQEALVIARQDGSGGQQAQHIAKRKQRRKGAVVEYDPAHRRCAPTMRCGSERLTGFLPASRDAALLPKSGAVFQSLHSYAEEIWCMQLIRTRVSAAKIGQEEPCEEVRTAGSCPLTMTASMLNPLSR